MTKLIRTAKNIWILELAALLALGVVLYSCSEKVVDPNMGLHLSYNDYIYVDTTDYILVRSHLPERYPYSYTEPRLDWEYSFGEPFTDNDSDGVFTQGIDGFIVSIRPDNQDLNRNSVYDPPGFQHWDIRIPFDDIDGNGTLTYCPGGYDGYGCELSGMPFADFNGNGVYDSLTQYIYTMRKRGVYSDRLGNPPEFYQFTSDSGIDYGISTAGTPAYFPPIVISDSGIFWSFKPLSYSSPFANIRIADTGVIDLFIDSLVHDSAYSSTRRGEVRLSNSYLTSLTILGREVWDLLKISVDWKLYQYDRLDSSASFQIYFSKEYGLVYFDTKNSNGLQGSCYDERYSLDQFPLPMTR